MQQVNLVTQDDLLAIHQRFDGLEALIKELGENKHAKTLPRLINAKQAAQLWGVSLTTFRKFAADLESKKVITPIRQGTRLIKYLESEILGAYIGVQNQKHTHKLRY